MKVILVRPVRKLGKIGEVVTVKPGFGRNFLVPQGFAVRATEANMAMIEEQKHEFEARNAEAHSASEALAKKIDGKDFVFIRQAAADGRLFGSVSNKEISTALQNAGYEISHTQVAIDKPIKSIGVYTVSLILHTEVGASVIVNVARSDSEAIDALKEFKNPKVKDEADEYVIEAPAEIIEAEEADAAEAAQE